MAELLAAKSSPDKQISNEDDAAKKKNKNIDKREAIIEAASTLFTTEGYEVTTIAAVAKRAGVAVGTVYLYFKNKQEILYAVKDSWDCDFVNYMSQVDLSQISHQERFRPLVVACFEACAQATERVQLMGLPPQVVGEMYQGKGLDKSGTHMQQMIKLWFEQAIKEEVFRKIDVNAAALIAYNMVSGVLEEYYASDNHADRKVYIDVLVDAFEHWLVRPELLKS